MTGYSKKRKIATALLIGVLVFISLLLLGAVLAFYLPGLNLNNWFQETANYWLVWRFILYTIIGMFVYRIHVYRPFPKQAILLVIAALALFEGLNWIYLL